MSDRKTFWLSDDGLDSICASVMELFSDSAQADDCVAAIRELRDRAKAVCESAAVSSAVSMIPGYESEMLVPTEELAKLREVLPWN